MTTHNPDMPNKPAATDPRVATDRRVASGQPASEGCDQQLTAQAHATPSGAAPLSDAEAGLLADDAAQPNSIAWMAFADGHLSCPQQRQLLAMSLAAGTLQPAVEAVVAQGKLDWACKKLGPVAINAAGGCPQALKQMIQAMAEHATAPAPAPGTVASEGELAASDGACLKGETASGQAAASQAPASQTPGSPESTPVGEASLRLVDAEQGGAALNQNRVAPSRLARVQAQAWRWAPLAAAAVLIVATMSVVWRNGGQPLGGASSAIAATPFSARTIQAVSSQHQACVTNLKHLHAVDWQAAIGELPTPGTPGSEIQDTPGSGDGNGSSVAQQLPKAVLAVLGLSADGALPNVGSSNATPQALAGALHLDLPGYRFVGLGPCSATGGDSVHLMYRPAPAPGTPGNETAGNGASATNENDATTPNALSSGGGGGMVSVWLQPAWKTPNAPKADDRHVYAVQADGGPSVYSFRHGQWVIHVVAEGKQACESAVATLRRTTNNAL